MSPRDNLRIVIADDHPVFRLGLRQIIEAEPGFEVVGEAGDGQGALEMIRTLRPAIAILDVAMPQLDGLVAGSAASRGRIIGRDHLRDDVPRGEAVQQGARGGSQRLRAQGQRRHGHRQLHQSGGGGPTLRQPGTDDVPREAGAARGY